MLSWVLRKGAEGASRQDRARDNTSDDTTNIDQPDTPAPVFAARALKSAIFGTPARPDEHTESGDMTGLTTDGRSEGAATPPSKPPGILLTPGTGTSRRKRVSFDHNTLTKALSSKDKKGRGDDSGKSLALPRGSTARRTRLTETMAQSRQSKLNSNTSAKPKNYQNGPEAVGSEEDWEEADDDDVDGDMCNHDITLDLNEPHSQSGKYWKSEFEQYHQDAKAEMEKLLKYKQLAKSYAKMKDAEAIDLNGKLKEEQERVLLMERQITEMAAQMASKRRAGDDGDNPQLMRDLAKQTTLAVQYRSQVKELEALLKAQRDDGSDQETKAHRRRQAASPRTQRTLIETQRELRRARSQVQENGELRERVKQLKAELAAFEKRADEAQVARGFEVADAKLESAQADLRRKDEELRKLKEEFEAYKTEAMAHEEDTKKVLHKATDKIADLKKEIRTLKAGTTGEIVADKPTTVSQKTETRAQRRRAERDDDNNRNNNKKSLFDTGDYPLPRDSLDVINTLSKKLNEDGKTKTECAKRGEYYYGIDDEARELLAAADKLLGTPAKTTYHVIEDRPSLEQPRWKPFIPRSPRNRDYLGSDLNEHIQLSANVPSGNTPAPTHRFKLQDIEHIDLLQDEFHRLGVPPFDTSAMKASINSALPPERRAAAIARIERRKAEKKRAMMEQSNHKENNKP